MNGKSILKNYIDTHFSDYDEDVKEKLVESFYFVVRKVLFGHDDIFIGINDELMWKVVNFMTCNNTPFFREMCEILKERAHSFTSTRYTLAMEVLQYGEKITNPFLDRKDLVASDIYPANSLQEAVLAAKNRLSLYQGLGLVRFSIYDNEEYKSYNDTEVRSMFHEFNE